MGTMVRAVSIGRWLRSAAVRLTAYLAIAYLTVGAFFYFRQATLLFPAPKTFEKKTPADSGLRFEDLRIAVDAGDHLHAWWIPAAAPTDKAILVFHGNGYVLEDMIGGEMANLRQISANLMLVDYRGYGSSTTIGPNETTIDEDAQASLGYLLRDRMIPSDKVFVLRSVDWQRPGRVSRSEQSAIRRLNSGEPLQQHRRCRSWFLVFPDLSGSPHAAHPLRQSDENQVGKGPGSDCFRNCGYADTNMDGGPTLRQGTPAERDLSCSWRRA